MSSLLACGGGIAVLLHACMHVKDSRVEIYIAQLRNCAPMRSRRIRVCFLFCAARAGAWLYKVEREGIFFGWGWVAGC